MFDHSSIAAAYNRKRTVKTCFSFDILVGMVRDILVGLLPERLYAYRYN